MLRLQSQSLSWSLWNRELRNINGSEVDRYILVASANHLCWAFLLTPFSSDCSEAATDPQGYSAPTPMPSRNLLYNINSASLRGQIQDSPTCTQHSKHTSKTVIGTAGCSRETREYSDDTSCSHLKLSLSVYNPTTDQKAPTIPNLRPIQMTVSKQRFLIDINLIYIPNLSER
jgi:hypothetical protein